MFAAESLSLIAEEKENTIYAWFPPTKSLVQISRDSGVCWPSDTSLIGEFCHVTVVGESITPTKYECVKPKKVFYPISKKERPFRTLNIDGMPVARDIPVVIGNYVLLQHMYIGFNPFFGRIAVPAIPSNGKLEQFNVYSCDLSICLLGSSYCSACRWEVSSVNCLATHTPSVRIVTARLRTVLNDYADFIFESEDGASMDFIHACNYDFAEAVSMDLKVGARVKLLCENPINHRGAFPSVAFYGTVLLFKTIEFMCLPVCGTSIYDHVIKKDNNLVQQIIARLGMEQINAAYPPNIVKMFEKRIILSAQVEAATY